MSIKRTEDFKLEAVRIALSSGLPRAKIANAYARCLKPQRCRSDVSN
jgi:transposase-like protein